MEIKDTTAVTIGSAALVAAGAAIFVISELKTQIKILNIRLDGQKRVTEIYKRNFKRAADKMTLPQLVEQVNEHIVDVKFDNITKNLE